MCPSLWCHNMASGLVIVIIGRAEALELDCNFSLRMLSTVT
jgi:hypothetical protein